MFRTTPSKSEISRTKLAIFLVQASFDGATDSWRCQTGDDPKNLAFFHSAQENRIFRHMLAITAAAAKPTMWHTFHSMCDTTVVVMITNSGESDTEPTIYRAGTFFFRGFSFIHSLHREKKTMSSMKGYCFFSFLHGFLSRQ